MNLAGKAFTVLREHGLGELVRRTRHRMAFARPAVVPSVVRFEDAQAVDWRTPHPAVTRPADRGAGPWTVAWIMSPPGISSGGHQNMLRFVRALEDAGHTCRIYLYSNQQAVVPAESAAVLRDADSFPPTAAEVLAWDGEVPDDVDAIVATSWETAYPSYRSTSPARRFYFVQDFEPWFTAAGSESTLAEATYRFGFRGITAGGWLASKLRDEYRMPADHFDFGSDPDRYRLEPGAARQELFFYARPSTPRRGFELGLMALDLVAKARPDVTINLVGEDLTRVDIPFAHRNLHGLRVEELGPLYNRCVAGLVLSFSNLSLLPLELLAAGVIPVVNDAPNNRLVVDDEHVVYVPPVPRAIADALLAALDAPDRDARAAAAAAGVAGRDWAVAGRQVVAAFEGGMR